MSLPGSLTSSNKTNDSLAAPGGVSFVHTIGGAASATTCDPWTQKYIFPNGQVPSAAQLAKAMEGLFVIDDVHNIGPHYDPTLMAWHARFTAAWPELRAKYDERFYRMWTYYLLMSAAAFRARYLHLFQFVMSRSDAPQPDCRKS